MSNMGWIKLRESRRRITYLEWNVWTWGLGFTLGFRDGIWWHASAGPVRAGSIPKAKVDIKYV